jgi:hypothetical protein
LDRQFNSIAEDRYFDLQTQLETQRRFQPYEIVKKVSMQPAAIR